MSFLLVVLLAACGGGDGENKAGEGPQAEKAAKAKAKARPAPKGSPVELAGILDFQDGGGAVLRVCGQDEPVQLKSGGGDPARVREELGAEVDDVWVEMRGLKQDDGTVVVRAFDVARGGFDGCASPTTATMNAQGSEPGWTLAIEGGELTFTPAGGAATTYPTLVRGEGRSPIELHATNESGGDLTLQVKRERCKDAAATAFYPWTATVSTGGTTYTGCARGGLPRLKPGGPAKTDKAEEEEGAGAGEE